jgi:hypothetical protein
MAKVRTEREWADIDARYDVMKRQTGWDTSHMAQQLRLSRQTLVDRLRFRIKQGTLADDVNPWAGEVPDTGPVQRPVQRSSPLFDTGAESSADKSAEDQAADRPVQTAVQKVDTGPVQTLATGAVQRIDQLEEDVRQLAEMMRSVMDRVNHIPVYEPMQITALPPYPKAKADRWNIWLNIAIREEITAWATERDLSPSQLVQELLWKALNDRPEHRKEMSHAD